VRTCGNRCLWCLDPTLLSPRPTCSHARAPVCSRFRFQPVRVRIPSAPPMLNCGNVRLYRRRAEPWVRKRVPTFHSVRGLECAHEASDTEVAAMSDRDQTRSRGLRGSPPCPHCGTSGCSTAHEVLRLKVWATMSSSRVDKLGRARLPCVPRDRCCGSVHFRRPTDLMAPVSPDPSQAVITVAAAGSRPLGVPWIVAVMSTSTKSGAGRPRCGPGP
jgi:hypothetical protein